MPIYLKTDSLGSFQMKGKQLEVDLHTVFLTAIKGVVATRRILFFRKKIRKPYLLKKQKL